MLKIRLYELAVKIAALFGLVHLRNAAEVEMFDAIYDWMNNA
jgi:hypothetical protein